MSGSGISKGSAIGAKRSQAFLMAEPERQNLARSPEYVGVSSLPAMWAIAADRFADVLAVHDPHSQPVVKLTYRELHQQMQTFAVGLQALGIGPTASCDEFPVRVALFSDNSPRWPVADQGIMLAGGVNVVRGGQADRAELLFILKDSGAVALVLENLALLKRLEAGLIELPPKFVILLSDELNPELSDETSPAQFPYPIFNFSQVMAQGQGRSLEPVQQTRATLATLMYTSGTGGQPKGVMLSHGNLLHQPIGAAAVAPLGAGQVVLSILPIWHAYERAFEYFIFSRGCTQVYTNIRYVKKDLKDYHPFYMVGVPRIWESIYEGIQKQLREQPASRQKLVKFLLGASLKYIQAQRIVQGTALEQPHPSAAARAQAWATQVALAPVHQLADRLVYQKIRDGVGGQLKFVVSGGGSIADHLEDFFEIVGIEILGGYGLTETSPITHVRRPWRNIRGADGQPLLDTETQIVDLETRQPLPFGHKGLVMIRGPQVMQGYFRNPTATAKAIDAEGWFDTGDLGLLTPSHDLVITGRAKDTIVLTSGENIEPQPIENQLLRCPYIDQIMLVGQDQKTLGALVVPNLEALEQHLGATPDLDSPAVQALIEQELKQRGQSRSGYRPDERMGPFRLLPEPFTIENGLLTQTLKIKRNVVSERYSAIIDEMFGS
jgi:long-chain acyl-CoA synthetase